MRSACWLATLALSVGCATEGHWNAPPPDVPPADVAAVASACNAFALDLLRALPPGPGEGLVFSPLSLATALGMASAGADGETLEELRAALHAPLPDEAYHAALGRLAWAVETGSGAELAVANRLFVHEGFELLAPFQATASLRYGAGAGAVDFGRPSRACDEVNRWAREATQGKVARLLAPDAVTVRTRLVLASAVHFKGRWAAPFEPHATRPGPFRLASGATTDVATMACRGPFGVADADGVTLVELPYRGDRLSMVVLLPAAPDGLPALEAGLTTDALAAWLSALRPEELELALPRFRLAADVAVRPALERLGVRAAFDDEAAAFGRLRREDDLFVSGVAHAAFVEVDEEGTEAAAATAVGMALRAAVPELRVVRVDRPFLFLVRDRDTGAILFLGRVVEPPPAG